MTKPTTSYARKGGSIAYSTLYHEWRRAAMAGRKDEADRLGRQHSAVYGLDGVGG